MSRTPGFADIIRALRLATAFERDGVSTAEGLEQIDAARVRRERTGHSRRDVLKGLGAAAATGVFGSTVLAKPARPSASVGIVGAGLAGLAAADTLAGAGIAATIYEGRDRIGGRQWSMGGTFPGPVMFPGQVVERGGELIDTTHTTMKGYAKQFGLKLEDVTKAWLPGEVTYYFGGRHVSEAEIVDDFRALVDALRPTLASLSNYVAYNSYSPFDLALDQKSLLQLLHEAGASALLTEVLGTVYTIEYGREIDRQSALGLLFFMHIDKRGRFQPFGVFSDERYHVLGGNEQIARGIAGRLPRPVTLGMRLIDVRKLSDGRIQLTFDRAGTSIVAVHDAVVLTLPYSTLRLVNLHPSLGIPAWQQQIIRSFDYGTNAKLNVGFTRRIWGDYGSEGSSYSDLPNHQSTWEPNPTNATPGNAVMLDYAGGARGARLDPTRVQAEAQAWLTNLDTVWPGAAAAAKRTTGNKLVAHLQHWPSDPFSLGSYTSNPPGYFTQWEGRVGLPVGNVFFGGEHTDSFYEWQGFMEGACNSGIRAAGELLDSL
ncbi:MAG: NAD(P)/FAD-dependent oxidoreductase [Vicinamibacterales bacterium]